MSRKGWLRFWVIFLLLGAPALAALGRAPDNDLWFLLAHGRYVLTQGFPHLEPFSLHQGLDFVMQQWLSGVLFQLIHEGAGLLGLALLAAFSAALSAWLFYRLAMGASKGDFPLSLLLTLLLSSSIRVAASQAEDIPTEDVVVRAQAETRPGLRIALVAGVAECVAAAETMVTLFR